MKTSEPSSTPSETQQIVDYLEARTQVAAIIRGKVDKSQVFDLTEQILHWHASQFKKGDQTEQRFTIEDIRPAEEIFNEVKEWHGITLSKYSAEHRCALEAAEIYANQFKEQYRQGERAAFEAGRVADSWSEEKGWTNHHTFDEWIKTRK